MQNKKMYFWAMLIFSLFILSSCSDSDKQEVEPAIEYINHADLVGVYEVTNVEGSLANVNEGDIWDLRVKNANIGCTNLTPYTYTQNTITIGEQVYNLLATAEETSFDVSLKDAIKFTIKRTQKNCGDVEEQIAKKDILGIFKVVKAYSHQSGEEPAEDASLLGKIWDIQETQLNINCATEFIEYTYEKNTIIVGEENYEVALEDAKLVISYVVENTITTVYLEKTDDATCPDEEEGEAPEMGDVPLDGMIGFAAAAGTTGGQGGTVHHFDNGTLLKEWLSLREKSKSIDPAIIWLSGTFTPADGRDETHPWLDIKETENITIYGTDGFRMKNLGLFINKSKNIIIRNIYMEMPQARDNNGADGITIQNSSKIWIDHCTFESMNQEKDFEDGSCDVVHGTTDVTISWNHFIKTQKSSLVGHSDKEEWRELDGNIRVTYHHNFFDRSSSRHPRVRFGTAHVFNNFYNGVTTYGAGSACSAMVLVEGNYFDGVRLPTDIATYPAKPSREGVSNLTDKEAGFLFAANNHFTGKPSNASEPYPFTNKEYKVYKGEKLATPLTRVDFTPSYQYVITKPEEVKDLVSTKSGVAKLPNYDKAPIEVDNGGLKDPEEPGAELANGWLAADIGEAAGVYTLNDDGSIKITGQGKLESGNQVLYYVYREVDLIPNMEVVAEIMNYTGAGTNNQGQTGIMLATDLTTVEKDFLHVLSGRGSGDSFFYSHRIAPGENSKRGTQQAATGTGKMYLKLRVEGNTYYTSYSLDGGTSYGKERTDTFAANLPSKVYLGLMVNSGDNAVLADAQFAGFSINGTPYGFTD